MAWTSVGFDGTITEIQWAGLSSLLGNGYVAAGNGDCVVTAVGGARQVSVAAGSLYGDGVLSTNSGAETVALTTPTNGQWYVVALRRTWATNTAALVAIAGATTTTTTPTAAPTSFPTLNTNVGVLTDQPIAWAWCNSANTTVVVFDIRLKPVKSLPPVVATSAERDAKFMSPTQGLQVWRDDLGAVETYYTAYNASTNPGGRDAAGWYTNDRQTGLIPVKPTAGTFVSGTGSINAIGKTSFTTVTGVILTNCFNSNYQNYRVVVTLKDTTSGDAQLYARLATGGTLETATSYFQAGNRNNTSSGGMTVDYRASTNYTRLSQSAVTTGGYSQSVIDVLNPFVSDRVTTWNYQSSGHYGYIQYEQGGSMYAVTKACDGFALSITAGTMTGEITVYGYNS